MCESGSGLKRPIFFRLFRNGWHFYPRSVRNGWHFIWAGSKVSGSFAVRLMPGLYDASYSKAEHFCELVEVSCPLHPLIAPIRTPAQTEHRGI